MNLRKKIAKALAPDLYSAEAVRDLVQKEVADGIKQARMAMPVTANYDPHGEGYRRMTGPQSQRRDLYAVDINRMFEIAYFMFDHSAMTRRMAKLDKGFLFAEPIMVTSNDDNVMEIITRFKKNNKLDMRFPDKVMWLGLLGEQCWPVSVNPVNGDVTLAYVDPINIKDVYVMRNNVEQAVQVELMGSGGRQGQRMAVIREDMSIRSKSYGRLVGECFFYSLNHPPNDPRGRSDYYTLFDWIDGLERYGYNFLERAEFLLNYIWDITLNGMNEEQIREWLRNNPPPEPGSQRAHNENVTWQAVSPDIKAHDFSKGFDMGKSFIMGSAGRPDSWYGGGGKAYQTEAEQFGQVPIKDLDERQQQVQYIYEEMIRFQLDQSVIHGRLTEAQAEAGFTVQMPEISKKDLTGTINGVPQLATALSIAEDKGWISIETAAMIFATVAGQMGVEVDVQDELEKAKKRQDGEGMEDYVGLD
ncbi:MAG: hypothetical protein SV375_00055 [Thermodesulfobacteriota bacterium]|nr:hypothetical protein [Thermodesulfobacteriota bacterium]